MSFPASEEPPAKKRRFFSDSDDDDYDDPTAKTNAVEPDRSPLAERPVAETSNRDVPTQPTQDDEAPAFDETSFEAFIGDKINNETLDIIRSNCGNNLERAVNMYFDGTWKRFKRQPKPKTVSGLFNRQNAALSSPQHVQPSDQPRKSDLPSRPLTSQSMPASRYIGALGVEGWATRSGTNLLKYGDTVKIERQKIQPKPGSTPIKANSVAARRVDVLVRFTDAKGTEIGRLAKDTAQWISCLMDQKICKFEGTCVYAPERLRTNDTVYLQLHCSILRSAFESSSFQLNDDRPTGLFEEKETSEERDLRIRQKSLACLLQGINLEPTRSSQASAKHNRQDLIDAAERDEKKEKEKPKSNNNTQAPSSSPPSDDEEDGQELEQDQLDALYRKAQSFDFGTPEAEPPDTFAMTLRPYQKQSLHWMISKEKDLKSEEREQSMHPLWEEYTWPTKDVDDKPVAEVPSQPTFYLNPYSGELSLDFPRQQQNCLGGILADEMGLGKTIQMLSLVHSHKSDAVLQAGKASNGVAHLPRLPGSNKSTLPAPKTTLVVAPMSLLSQWQNEAENASVEGSLKSMVYYGNEKSANLQALCSANLTSAPDVIITSYGVVLSEFTRNAKSREGGDTGLFSLDFFRIILDEAHTIKNRQSKTSKACYSLSAAHRWVLTGTPIVNRLEDLFSLVKFLRVEPWNNFAYWRTFVTTPFESGNYVRALDVVQTVLEPLVMRRTKDMKTPDGDPLVALPPKKIDIVDVELSKVERAVYDHIFTRAKKTLASNAEKGTVMKAYTTIFAQILRLRQSCCHPTLVRHQEINADEEAASADADAAAGLTDDMDLQSLIERFTADMEEAKDGSAFGAHALQEIRDEAENECTFCFEEPMIEQTVTGCWHSACQKCLLDYIEKTTDNHQIPKCFNCREPINSRDLFEVVRNEDDDDESGAKSAQIRLQRLGVNNSSSKVVALMQHLRDIRREHPRMKSVVFTQFTSFMPQIESALSKANMKFLRLDGTMAQKARAAVLDEFRQSNRFTILLISLRAGGVGLNLTQAKRVFMMDPWWSFAVESQAIDRVHRMGQDEEVKVYRFIVKESVEERMLKIQDRKKFIATSLGMMTDEEKKLQRLEDIRELLS